MKNHLVGWCYGTPCSPPPPPGSSQASLRPPCLARVLPPSPPCPAHGLTVLPYPYPPLATTLAHWSHTPMDHGHTNILTRPELTFVDQGVCLAPGQWRLRPWFALPRPAPPCDSLGCQCQDSPVSGDTTGHHTTSLLTHPALSSHNKHNRWEHVSDHSNHQSKKHCPIMLVVSWDKSYIIISFINSYLVPWFIIFPFSPHYLFAWLKPVYLSVYFYH